jgi:hypothetical protein
MPKANQNPNTTRNTSSRCVMARITRNGEKHQKNFTLRQYGTWKAAQAAADKWVAETKRALPPPAPRKDRMTRRNSSGIVSGRHEKKYVLSLVRPLARLPQPGRSQFFS